MHVKGHAAAETKAAVERARELIAQAEALGEPPEDPLLLFSVLFGFWIANYVAFDGDIVRDLANQFLVLAEQQGTVVPLMMGHRLVGYSLSYTGDIAAGRVHLDRAVALYDPTQHRPLATRFSIDTRVAVLSLRSHALWLLGYPEAAFADAHRAVSEARDINQAAAVMLALAVTSLSQILCGNYAEANAQSNELVMLADEKSAAIWKAFGIMNQGAIFVLDGKADERGSNNQLRTHYISLDGSNTMDAMVSPKFGKAYAELGPVR